MANSAVARPRWCRGWRPPSASPSRLPVRPLPWCSNTRYPTDDALSIWISTACRPGALEAIGFEEYLEADDIIAIEWAERAEGLLPATTLHIDIRLSETEPGTRLISLRGGAAAPQGRRQ